jgi:hypothetical protein
MRQEGGGLVDFRRRNTFREHRVRRIRSIGIIKHLILGLIRNHQLRTSIQILRNKLNNRFNKRLHKLATTCELWHAKEQIMEDWEIGSSPRGGGVPQVNSIPKQ